MVVMNVEVMVGALGRIDEVVILVRVKMQREVDGLVEVV